MNQLQASTDNIVGTVHSVLSNKVSSMKMSALPRLQMREVLDYLIKALDATRIAVMAKDSCTVNTYTKILELYALSRYTFELGKETLGHHELGGYDIIGYEDGLFNQLRSTPPVNMTRSDVNQVRALIYSGSMAGQISSVDILAYKGGRFLWQIEYYDDENRVDKVKAYVGHVGAQLRIEYNAHDCVYVTVMMDSELRTSWSERLVYFFKNYFLLV
jgi:hypothetical protein